MSDITLRKKLKEKGWKGPKRQDSLDAAVEWLYCDFENGGSAEKASFFHNILGDFTFDHFGE